ncbi:MAG: type II CAAX endopeptidase family protein [Armatimonadota bacterium]
MIRESNNKKINYILLVLLIIFWLVVVLSKFNIDFDRPVQDKAGRELKLAEVFLKCAWAIPDNDPAFANVRTDFLETSLSLYKQAFLNNPSDTDILSSCAVITYELKKTKEPQIYINKIKKRGEAEKASLLESVLIKKEKFPANKINSTEERIEALFSRNAASVLLYNFYDTNGFAKERNLIDYKNENEGRSLLVKISLLGLSVMLVFSLGTIFMLLFAFKLYKNPRLLKEKLNEEISLRKAFLIFILWDFLHIGAGLALYVMGLKSITIINIVAVYAVISFFVLFLIFKSMGIQFLQTEGGLFRDILWGFGGYCAILPVMLAAAIVNYIIFSGMDISSNPVFKLMGGNNTPLDNILLFLMVVILGPLVEEIVFRGCLFTAFRKHFGFVFSLFLVSFLFAFIHGDLFALIPIFCIGFILGIVYEYTGSVRASFVTHALWNLNTFIIFMLFLK